MTFKEFLDHTGVSITEFADAIGVSKNTLYQMIKTKSVPKLELAYRMIIQSGYNITIEDLIPESDWKPRKLKSRRKFSIEGKKLKKHQRRQFFRDIDNI